MQGGRAGGAGGEVNWAPDGKHFAYFKGKQIMLYDVPGKRERELLSLEPLESAASKVPASETFDWQNRRVRENSLEWSSDGKEILLSVQGDIFLWHMTTSKWDQLTATPVVEDDPKISSDGKRVAFRREHDLYVMDLASRKLNRLTADGKSTLLNGELDWV